MLAKRVVSSINQTGFGGKHHEKVTKSQKILEVVSLVFLLPVQSSILTFSKKYSVRDPNTSTPAYQTS